MLPHSVEVVERIEESPGIFTLRLRFSDAAVHAAYSFEPGQFNMLYLPEVGEVPISIVSDPEDEHMVDHTIRAVGRVTRGLQALRAGERLGLRGPYGKGWPLAEAEGREVAIITGGLGCAPVVAAINYILRRRERYGRLVIMQGVRHSDDLIWRERYNAWARLENVDVYLAASQPAADWPWHVGRVPGLFEEAALDVDNTIAMMCGPEGMMKASAEALIERGHARGSIYLSLERNMQCGLGRCGHCQLGPKFVCKDGPVFSYPEIESLLRIKGI